MKRKAAFLFYLCLVAGFAVVSVATTEAAAPKKAKTQIPQVAEIDRMIREVWQEYKLKPSPEANEGEWCRRVYLDLIGRIPSVQELDSYLSDRSQNKDEKLVEKLLYDDSYTEEYARNWTTIWSNVLIGRTGGNEDNSLINREGMLKYLRDAYARNVPYDKMVHELVGATGNTTPGTEDFNGATNFLIMKVNEEKGSLATAAISRIFLGLQVQCTQCHNHPFNDWKQQKYWEMNAFLRQTRALRKFAPGSRDVQSAELVDQDFAGESGNAKKADVFYELRNGVVSVAFPVFVDGRRISSDSGFVSEVNRRAELAKFVVESEYLEKTAVNRMWSHFLGYGFTKPVDDMGPHNVPSHPALLDYLATEFRKTSFDTKQLIKWITLTEAYSLSSKAKNNSTDDPLMGVSPKFTHFYLRQMRAEELYESLVTATMAEKGRSYEEQEKVKNQWLQQFNTAFGTDEGDETTSFNGTIPQVLMMFNGDLVKQAVSADKSGFVGLVFNNVKPTERVDYLFKAGLARDATKDEKLAYNILMAKRGDEMGALQDLWWAVLNSNEFIFNH